jgi:2-polyprenyl-3-methyl-5-hydroxy-6-metoxy-1,4-benzoquinol methylase
MAAADDWDEHWRGLADSAALNPAQAMRRRLVRALLGADAGAPSVRILDVGCGQGDLVAELRRRLPGAELGGLDTSREGLEVARAKVPGAWFERRDLLRSGSPEPDRAGWATHAVCSEVLEHVDDPVALLANARAYMAPGCRLVVTVPGGPMSAFDRHIGHRRHHTAASLRELLAAAGLEVERSTGAGFPFFNLYRLVVVLRGERMVGDAAGTPSRAARLAMAAFRALLSLPAPYGRWGWQRVAVARAPAAD